MVNAQAYEIQAPFHFRTAKAERVDIFEPLSGGRTDIERGVMFAFFELLQNRCNEPRDRIRAEGDRIKSFRRRQKRLVRVDPSVADVLKQLLKGDDTLGSCAIVVPDASQTCEVLAARARARTPL